MNVSKIPDEIWGRFFEYMDPQSCFAFNQLCRKSSIIFYQHIPYHMAVRWISTTPEKFSKLSESYRVNTSFILDVLRTASLPYSCVKDIQNKEDREKIIKETAVAFSLRDCKKAVEFPDFFTEKEKEYAYLSVIKANDVLTAYNNNTYTEETFKDITRAQIYHLVTNVKILTTRMNMWLNNKTMVIEALMTGLSFDFSRCTQLLDDPDVALLAVGLKENNLKFINPKLQRSKKIVSRAVRSHGLSLEHASEEFKNDFDIVFRAVRKKGSSLQFASSTLQNTIEIVTEAVKQEGASLQYASVKLKTNKNIILEAIRNDPDSLQYADEMVKKDKKFFLEAAHINWKCIKHVQDPLQSDTQFIRQFAQKAEVKIEAVESLIWEGVAQEIYNKFNTVFSFLKGE